MELIYGWKDIGRRFGTTGKDAHVWYNAGAPILVLKETPVTVIEDLWPLLLKEYGMNKSGVSKNGMSAAEAKKVIPENGE